MVLHPGYLLNHLGRWSKAQWSGPPPPTRRGAGKAPQVILIEAKVANQSFKTVVLSLWSDWLRDAQDTCWNNEMEMTVGPSIRIIKAPNWLPLVGSQLWKLLLCISQEASLTHIQAWSQHCTLTFLGKKIQIALFISAWLCLKYGCVRLFRSVWHIWQLRSSCRP